MCNSNRFFSSKLISLSEFYNPEILNIFSDASIVKKTHGCYGAVVVCGDNILDQSYKLVSNTTCSNSEIKGLRLAISLANKWSCKYKKINIFSDSQVSVFGIRDYIYKWKYNVNDNLFYGSSGSPVANQNIFIESYYMLMNLINKGIDINLFHQSGHIDNNYDRLKKAADIFARSNNINGNIDLNLIRYISTYNNFVDNNSRSILRNSNIKINYCDPIYFNAHEKISKNNKY